MKKLLILFGGIWLFVFLVSLKTAPALDFGRRILYSLVFAVIGTGLVYCNTGKNKAGSGSNASPGATDKRKMLYIFRGTERNFAYRYDGKYVYEGMSDKFIYRVEGNRIFQGMDSAFSYRMEGNRIYRGMENQPLYRIDGNCIYSGDFGRQPVFRISNHL